MLLPNFLIIGAAKAGTTSIAQYLKQHPQIYISPVKEPYFFSLEGQQANFKGPGDIETFSQAVTTLDEYKQLFAQVNDEIAIGEASVSYLHVPKTAENIFRHLPDVKLIAILRDPVEKAYSCFLHQIREGNEPLKDFAKALEEEEQRLRNNWMFIWHYRKNGFYYEQLKPYYDLFNKNQIKIFLYEDLNQNIAGLLQDIFRFVGVDETFVPDLSIRYNMTGIPRSKFLYKLLDKPSLIKTVLRPLFPQKIRQALRKQSLAKPKLTAEIRSKLIVGYRDDILKLEDLIQRDLSKWLI